MKITAELVEVSREPIVGDICWNVFYNFFIWSEKHKKNGSRHKSQEYNHFNMKIYELKNIKKAKWISKVLK